jgi:hypothetical protein
MKKHATHRSRRGQALIIIAGALVALMALVALAVDGSNAFAQRRNAQNAVDGASVAGTNLLLQYYMNAPTDPHPGNRQCTDMQHPCTEHDLTPHQNQLVFQAVQSTLAAQTGIDTQSKWDPTNPGTLDVRWIDQDGHTFGGPVGNNASVPLAGGQGPGSPGAAGIWVQTTSSSGTYFARILGINSVSADAHSAAQIGNPESAVWPPQQQDESGNLPTLIVWPITIIMDPQSIQSFNGTMDIYNFDSVAYGPATFDVLDYAQTGSGNQACRTGHMADMRCMLQQGFNAANTDTPLKAYLDDQGGTRAGARLPDLQKMPLGSDGVNQNSHGVWIQSDSQYNRVFTTAGWNAIVQNALNFHWTMLLPISDHKDATGSVPKYRVVNMAAVKILLGEQCTSSNSYCGSGEAGTNRAHFRVQFKPGEWNTARADSGDQIYKSIQNGQFVLQQGH